MRARLTLAFSCFVLVMTSLGGLVRVHALGETERTNEVTSLSQAARFVAVLTADLRSSGADLETAQISAFVPPNTRLTISAPGTADLTIEDPGFDASRDADPDTIRVQESVDSTQVSIEQDPSVLEQARRQAQSPLLGFLVVLVLFAGFVGFLVASALARPFNRLAESAAALGRGRFDIEPPRSRIPEVVSIATSLEKSAGQLQDSLRRDREFFHHASHVLRTPLTGMRLELEELSLRADVNGEVQESIARALADAERLDGTVSELLEFARARQLVAGAEVTLLTLGAEVAQRWRDRLPESRTVRAFVDGGHDVTLTPGPVEQLLDNVLRDVEHGSGPVTLRFDGQDEHVKVTISSGPGRSRGGEWPTAHGASTIAEVLGGRCSGDAVSGELEILLPRR